ncbi:hypothetical protein [Dendronalium sp. ChiSLP03b]|uniref:hypothetical protein n=1 Tax=Dendronalium sp. ChiSLP03b TaxID=3075381 RepID=UPI00391BD0C1
MERSPPCQITERLIPESQLRDAVKEILAEMLGLQATDPKSQRKWYDTEQAYSLLGLNSAEQLREMVRDGRLRLKEGQSQDFEVRDVRSPNSAIPRYQFHIEKCEARLAMPPEKRSHKKRAA